MHSRQIPFHLGLTSSQIATLHQKPFMTPTLVRLASEVSPRDNIPIVVVLNELNDAMDSSYWIPAGDTFRMHPAVMSRAIETLMYSIDMQLYTPSGGNEKIHALQLLYLVLDLLELVGIFRRGPNYYMLSDQWEEEIRARDYRRAFPLIFETYTTEFKWEKWNPETYDPVQSYAVRSLVHLAAGNGSIRDVCTPTRVVPTRTSETHARSSRRQRCSTNSSASGPSDL